MRIGRWRRWRGGEAGEKGRIGEYEEGRMNCVCRWKTDLVDKLEYLLLLVCPHPVFKQAVVCKEGRQILTNRRSALFHHHTFLNCRQGSPRSRG